MSKARKTRIPRYTPASSKIFSSSISSSSFLVPEPAGSWLIRQAREKESPSKQANKEERGSKEKVPTAPPSHFLVLPLFLFLPFFAARSHFLFLLPCLRCILCGKTRYMRWAGHFFIFLPPLFSRRCFVGDNCGNSFGGRRDGGENKTMGPARAEGGRHIQRTTLTLWRWKRKLVN